MSAEYLSSGQREGTLWDYGTRSDPSQGSSPNITVVTWVPSCKVGCRRNTKRLHRNLSADCCGDGNGDVDMNGNDNGPIPSLFLRIMK